MSPAICITADPVSSVVVGDPQVANDSSAVTAIRSPALTSTGGLTGSRFLPANAVKGPRSATSVNVVRANGSLGRRNFSLNAPVQLFANHFTEALVTVPSALAGCERSMRVYGGVLFRPTVPPSNCVPTTTLCADAVSARQARSRAMVMFRIRDSFVQFADSG